MTHHDRDNRDTLLGACDPYECCKAPRVVVFGAGISGLSAAQELIERGFEVHVVDPTGQCEVQVGGIARTQWAHVPVPGPKPALGGPEHDAAWLRYCDWFAQPMRPVFQVPTKECFAFSELTIEVLEKRLGERSEERAARMTSARLKASPSSKGAKGVEGAEASKVGQPEDAVVSEDQPFLDGPALPGGLGLPLVQDGPAQDGPNKDVVAELLEFQDFLQDSLARQQKWTLTSKAQLRSWSDRLEPSRRLLREIDGEFSFVDPQGQLSGVALRDMKSWFDALFEFEYELSYAPRVAEPVARAMADSISEWLKAPVHAREDPELKVAMMLWVCPPSGRVPGEHGYRYFPSFYRNLFDSMQRIRLYDDGQETRYTAIDNLVGAPDLHLALPDDRPPLPLPRRRIRSFEELRRMLSSRWGRLGAMPSDIRHLERRMLRYLTSSSARREQHYQGVTWWEFLDGHRLRPQMHRLLRHTPQALIAMDVEEVDARTHGNILVQLLLDHLRPGAEVDRVLNGPTTLALLDPWKEYLLRQGVTFHSGYVESLEWKHLQARIRPVVHYGGFSEDLDHDGQPRRFELADPATVLEESDYFVLAVPYLQALELTRTLRHNTGSPLDKIADERTFYKQLGRSFRAVIAMASETTWPEQEPQSWAGFQQSLQMPRSFDADHASGVWKFHRLFTGVQYFFDKNIRIGNGHVYYPGSLWGLSSISQQQFWKKPQDPATRLYGSISVDLGNCMEWERVIDGGTWQSWLAEALTKNALQDPLSTAPQRLECMVGGGVRERSMVGDVPTYDLVAPKVPPPGPFPILWANFRSELLMEVASNAWRQLEDGLYRGTRDRLAVASWFHVDAYLRKYWEYGYPDSGTPGTVTLGVVDLLEPPGPWYLINSPALRWEDRPGFYIDHPAFTTQNGAIQALPRLAREQSYASFDPDRSRILWYEVANEQWVLAGAYNKTYTRLETMEAANESAKHAVNAILEHWMEDREGPQLVQPMFGEFCEVWNPEQNELDDLEFLRRLDEMLMRDGLPHFMDILELDDRLEARATPGLGAAGRPVDLFLKLLDAASRTGSTESKSLMSLLSKQANLAPLRELLRSLGNDESS